MASALHCLISKQMRHSHQIVDHTLWHFVVTHVSVYVGAIGSMKYRLMHER